MLVGVGRGEVDSFGVSEVLGSLGVGSVSVASGVVGTTDSDGSGVGEGSVVSALFVAVGVGVGAAVGLGVGDETVAEAAGCVTLGFGAAVLLGSPAFGAVVALGVVDWSGAAGCNTRLRDGLDAEIGAAEDGAELTRAVVVLGLASLLEVVEIDVGAAVGLGLAGE